MFFKAFYSLISVAKQYFCEIQLYPNLLIIQSTFQNVPFIIIELKWKYFLALILLETCWEMFNVLATELNRGLSRTKTGRTTQLITKSLAVGSRQNFVLLCFWGVSLCKSLSLLFNPEMWKKKASEVYLLGGSLNYPTVANSFIH
jgi:hypothetical protein